MRAFEQFATGARRFCAVALLSVCAGGSGLALSQEVKVALSGAEEIPPVQTSASGVGRISVAADRSVSGSVTVSGMTVSVAHIHEGRAGTTGPVIVPLAKTADNVWSVPPDTKLTEAQYDSYKAGNLYYNVHSATNKTGEIRGQIRP
jgi:hypothetical protein